MKKAAIFCHGVPSLETSQPHADALMHAIKLKKIYEEVRIFSIFNTTGYQSNKDQLIYKKDILEKYKIKIHIIYNNSRKNLFKRILNKFSLRLYPNVIDNRIIKRSKIYLSIYKPNVVINFFERAIEVNEKSELATINFLSIPLHLVENLRRKLRINSFFSFRYFSSFLFGVLFKLTLKKKTDSALLNFISCKESYEIYKKMKIKNLKFIYPLNRIKKKNIYKKKNTILMIGNLQSTFVVDGLKNLNDNLIKNLEDLRNEVDFEINIIGKFESEKEKYPNLNKPWIKYLGWIDDVNPYFEESCMLLVPSQHKLSVRTKILDAFSAGLPVVTYENNNFDKKLFLKNENAILAENKYSLVEGIKKLLIDDNFRNKISNNSFKTYHLNIDPIKTVANNIRVVNNALRFVKADLIKNIPENFDSGNNINLFLNGSTDPTQGGAGYFNNSIINFAKKKFKTVNAFLSYPDFYAKEVITKYLIKPNSKIFIKEYMLKSRKFLFKKNLFEKKCGYFKFQDFPSNIKDKNTINITRDLGWAAILSEQKIKSYCLLDDPFLLILKRDYLQNKKYLSKIILFIKLIIFKNYYLYLEKRFELSKNTIFFTHSPQHIEFFKKNNIRVKHIPTFQNQTKTDLKDIKKKINNNIINFLYVGSLNSSAGRDFINDLGKFKLKSNKKYKIKIYFMTQFKDEVKTILKKNKIRFSFVAKSNKVDSLMNKIHYGIYLSNYDIGIRQRILFFMSYGIPAICHVINKKSILHLDSIKNVFFYNQNLNLDKILKNHKTFYVKKSLNALKMQRKFYEKDKNLKIFFEKMH